jgi:hypothetical protein
VLNIGIRINSSSVDAFTRGNMLYQSLHLEPADCRFEDMVLSFADVAYQYQANTAEYVDKTHAAYYGRPGSPLTSQRHVVGCSTLSQGLRIASTEVREEIGGINQSEWRNLRKGTFKTTVLGLTSGIGKVMSITDPLRKSAISCSHCLWIYARCGDINVPTLVSHVLLHGIRRSDSQPDRCTADQHDGPAPSAGSRRQPRCTLLVARLEPDGRQRASYADQHWLASVCPDLGNRPKLRTAVSGAARVFVVVDLRLVCEHSRARIRGVLFGRFDAGQSRRCAPYRHDAQSGNRRVGANRRRLGDKPDRRLRY